LFLRSFQEINHLLEMFDKPTEMPPLSALAVHGPPGMTHAVRAIHGGKEAVARRMGLSLGRMPRGFWCVAANRERAVVELIESMSDFDPSIHMPNVMPTKRAMIAAGRADLAQALERHGGFDATSRTLGLKYPCRKTKTSSKVSRVSLCVCMDGQMWRDRRCLAEGEQ
jgi:hypothetical protein